MISHAEYHAANPLPSHYITKRQRTYLLREPPTPLAQVNPPKPLGEATSKQQAYREQRENKRDTLRASILLALRSPQNLAVSVSVLAKMVGVNRCITLKHLVALEEGGKVERTGVSATTKWRLTA